MGLLSPRAQGQPVPESGPERDTPAILPPQQPDKGLRLAWGNQQPSIRRVLIGTLVFGVVEAVFALSHLYLLSLVLIAGVGGAEIAFATLAMTLLQTVAPDHLRGRVMSVCILFFDGS